MLKMWVWGRAVGATSGKTISNVFLRLRLFLNNPLEIRCTR
jgi:hypothetical protein